MAIASALSSQGFSSGVSAQVQQRQAQRRANQAESQARALQAQARDAQSVANSAQQDARSLNIQADRAQGEAFNARQGVAAVKQNQSSEIQLSSALESAGAKPIAPAIIVPTPVKSLAATDSSVVSLAPVVNTFGEQTGTLVNVTA
jgi:ATPase subunit of ABC transporter with duplicated ATPase domains